MAQLSDRLKIDKSFAHSLGRTLTEGTQNPYEMLYKSSHNVRSKEIWAADIPFCATQADADIFTAANPTIVKKYTQAVLTAIPGSNNQAYYLNDTRFVRPWISPVDAPNDVTNAPSDGFLLQLYQNSGVLVPPTTLRWQIDYYAGIILFEVGYTPVDAGYALPLKATLYTYIGPTGGGGGPTPSTSTGFLLDKGEINFASDLPLATDVKVGWLYRVISNVVDNDPLHTNTGQVLLAGSKIAWNGINWTTFDNEILGSPSTSYIRTFTDAELSSTGTILLNHNLTTEYTYVLIVNSYNQQVIPDQVLFVNINNTEVDLSSFRTLLGTWTAVVISGGTLATSLNNNYTQNFTNTDLSSTGTITFTHSLGNKYAFVLIVDEADNPITPAGILYVDANNVYVDLYGYAPITGTWRAIISIGGGSSTVPPVVPSYQIDTIVSASSTKLVDTVVAGAVKTMKYLVYMDTPTKYSSKEVMVLNKNGSIMHSISYILGDRVFCTFDIEQSGSNIEFHMINNETVPLSVNILRQVTYA